MLFLYAAALGLSSLPEDAGGAAGDGHGAGGAPGVVGVLAGGVRIPEAGISNELPLGTSAQTGVVGFGPSCCCTPCGADGGAEMKIGGGETFLFETPRGVRGAMCSGASPLCKRDTDLACAAERCRSAGDEGVGTSAAGGGSSTVAGGGCNGGAAGG